MATDHLATYLNDHLAGAQTALEILETLQQHEDRELRETAGSLRRDILEDHDELTRLMRGADVTVSPVRRAVGWIGEKASALKLIADDPRNTGLRTFESLEIVALGIDGKRALWAVLRTLADVVPGLRTADYGRLAQRADQQRAVAEALRLKWAVRTMSSG